MIIIFFSFSGICYKDKINILEENVGFGNGFLVLINIKNKYIWSIKFRFI